MEKREPERQVFARRDSAGRPVADQLVTFTQVGWISEGRGFYPLDSYPLLGEDRSAWFSPIWVEGPNE